MYAVIIYVYVNMCTFPLIAAFLFLRFTVVSKNHKDKQLYKDIVELKHNE